MIDLEIAQDERQRAALALLKAMEDRTLRDHIRSACTEDLVWANSGIPTLNGQQAIFDLMDGGGFARMIPILGAMTAFTADILHIASNGDAVFTERVDHHWDAQGRDLMTPHICGIMEFRGDRICAIRDFYDTACYAQEPREPA
jgi:limonene-1,2-epoxide hydrolase